MVWEGGAEDVKYLVGYLVKGISYREILVDPTLHSINCTRVVD
jgi:hypothetical protein